MKSGQTYCGDIAKVIIKGIKVFMVIQTEQDGIAGFMLDAFGALGHPTFGFEQRSLKDERAQLTQHNDRQ